jgi:hypothetical protein
MNITQAIKGVGFGLLFLSFGTAALAAPPCKGPNKNDPGCGGEEPPVEAVGAAVVDSITVDWLGQALIVRGADLDTVAAFGLAGNAGPLPTQNVTPTQLEIPFDAGLAAEVAGAGSYAVTADGASVLTVYIEAGIVDPAATGCPCEAGWVAALGAAWGVPESECLEIEGPGANDPADISGTVLSDPTDPTVYPHYPIGASFYPGEPLASSCRLVQVDGDATQTDLVNVRINEIQQADCRTTLALNVCQTITPLP